MANVTRATLGTVSATNFPDNTSQLISPFDLRDWITDGIDSFVTQKDVSTFENAFYECRGSALTAAATVNLSLATGNFVHITGAATITSFGTLTAGARFVLVFDGICILTYNATSLIIPGTANKTTAAGDACMIISEGSGNWRIVGYFAISGSGGGGITALTGDVTASGTGSVAATIANGAVDIPMLSATGSPSATTFLRGDNTWATPSGASPTGYYGAFQDTTTQTAVSANTAYPVKFNTTDLTNAVTVVNDGSSNPTRITLANAGIYNIQFSLQLEKTGGSGNFIVDIWVRKNGVDIPSTTGKVVLTGSASASPIVAAWNYVLDLAATDYVQLMWSTSNNNAVLLASVATPPHPSVPSAILTVTQQSGIMAGTGITGMVGTTGVTQTGATQTLSSSDMTITSAANAHTFAIPSAGIATKGLVDTSAQTFTGIKTFGNGTSAGELRLLEGSGGGTNYLALKAAATLAANLSLTLPNADGSNGQVLQTNGSGTLSWVTNGGRAYITDITANTVTGTSELLLTSVLIPANTFVADSHIQVQLRLNRPSTTGQTTIKFYVNTSNAVGGTNFGTYVQASNANTAFKLIRSLSIINATTTTNYVTVVNSVGTDWGVGTDTNAAIDWTVNQYIVISAQSSSVTGTNTSRALIISQM